MHFISSIDKSFQNDVLDKQGRLKDQYKDKIRLQKSPYLNTEYLGILVDSSKEMVKNSPLKNKLVRRAINYGFDRIKMITYLRNLRSLRNALWN